MSAPDNRTYTPIGVCPCPVSVRRRKQLEVLSDQRDRRGMVWAPVADTESPISIAKLNEINAEVTNELRLACSVACFGEALKGKDEMTAIGHGAVAEDFIAMMDETGSFDIHLGLKLINRSRELPTTATPERLLNEVLDDWVRANFAKLSSFRVSRYMQGREIPMIVEALKPLCSRAFLKLNIMLSVERDTLFASRDYVQVRGRQFAEEAPSATFTRFLNDMERLKAFGSETYERNIVRIAEVHALNRVAEIMPREFHHGWSGMLEPGLTYDAMKEAEAASFRDPSGIHTWADLLHEAGAA
ncbi:hypothetical protein DFP89_1217 [Paracoccus lutimaris]|uniref:Uncharacterized protein n=2 Tax=Paracoccus lutimaris TaxID=1490030 RepID=A0A368YKF0_9RHOB|nr:hypothetical protein DFP89_1217 [Paracoccus lutimaris]